MQKMNKKKFNDLSKAIIINKFDKNIIVSDIKIVTCRKLGTLIIGYYVVDNAEYNKVQFYTEYNTVKDSFKAVKYEETEKAVLSRSNK